MFGGIYKFFGGLPPSASPHTEENADTTEEEGPATPTLAAPSPPTTVDRLRAIGGSLTTLDAAPRYSAPTVYVLGHQSTSKSTLINAIVGAEINRTGSTFTTKVPLEIHSRPAAARRAQVGVKVLGGAECGADVVRLLRSVDPDALCKAVEVEEARLLKKMGAAEASGESKESSSSSSSSASSSAPSSASSASSASPPASDLVVTDHRIVVYIEGPSCRSINITDLPGIVSFPEEKSRASKAVLARIIDADDGTNQYMMIVSASAQAPSP